MLNYVIKQTDKFMPEYTPERKNIGQIFTPKETACFMANMFSLPSQETLNILDPGAGTGILSAALVESLQAHDERIKRIYLTCYETNPDAVKVLKKTLKYLVLTSKIRLDYSIIQENYILSQTDNFRETLFASSNAPKYDYVISNPPYIKLNKRSHETLAMKNVCYGAPNTYSLFAMMSLFNLRDEGEMVYIIPRSWTSGAYFQLFRDYLFEYGVITDMHLYTSRSNIFDKDKILQETMIIKVRKTKSQPSSVKVTSSKSPKDYSYFNTMTVPYEIIVSGAKHYVRLVTSEEDMNVLEKVMSLGEPLPSIGLKMKTGLTVDFRNEDIIYDDPNEHTVPLFSSRHLKGGETVFPRGMKNEYISDKYSGVLQRNRNYLFFKRFTTKEEKRRLQCAVYLAQKYSKYQMISTNNKINFIDTVDGSDMSDELLYGLYVIFNSSLYDRYYRILNGSTQVNSSEMNSIPVPTRKKIELIGRKMMEQKDYSTQYCNDLFMEIIGIKASE